MPIDTSIYGNIQQPQIENPLNALAKVSQVKAMQNQNRLADLAYGTAQREQESQNALADAYKSAVDPTTGAVDRNKLMTSLAQGGQGAKLPGIQKQFSEMDAAALTQQKAKLENTSQQLELVGRYMTAAKQNPAMYPQLVAQLREVIPGGGKDLPDQYDPSVVDATINRAMSVKESIAAHQKDLDFQLEMQKFAYQQQNDAANRGVTMRGQNMTDSRQRDANDIKRSEAQQAKDQAKAGQVASFDTMLGTLDRLSKHPGLHRSVGVIGAFPTSPGSDSANFQAELNTFQSQAFVPMVAQLKGMGALSDAEGKKLTAAVGALDPKMGEQAFRDSIARITKDMKAARDRVSGTGVPQAGQVMDGYRFKGGDPSVQSNWEKQ